MTIYKHLAVVLKNYEPFNINFNITLEILRIFYIM